MFLAGGVVVEDVAAEDVFCEFAEVARHSSLENRFVELIRPGLVAFKLTHYAIIINWHALWPG